MKSLGSYAEVKRQQSKGWVKIRVLFGGSMYMEGGEGKDQRIYLNLSVDPQILCAVLCKNMLYCPSGYLRS